jgi:hypothetical protein
MSRRLKSVAVVSLAKNSSIPCSVEDYEFLFRIGFFERGSGELRDGLGFGRRQTQFISLFVISLFQDALSAEAYSINDASDASVGVEGLNPESNR